MTPAEQLAFLQELYRETLDLFQARQGNSRSVAGYDANNGYQQVLGRQEIHLQWLADAVAGLGGAAPEQASLPPGSAGREAARAVIDRDVRAQQAMLDKWSPRVESMTNARHRRMLELIMGEMREHLRVLQLAAEERSDVLGRHADGKVLRGSVLAARPKN